MLRYERLAKWLENSLGWADAPLDELIADPASLRADLRRGAIRIKTLGRDGPPH